MNISTDKVDWHEQFHLVLFLFEIVIVVPTVIGNSMLIYCIQVNKNLHTKSYILIANLAVADLLCGLLFMPFDITTYIYPKLRENKFTCLLRNSLSFWSVGASILNLLLISIDRFLAILKPFTHLTTSKKYVFSLICVSWTSSTTLAYLPLIGWNSWNEEDDCIDEWLTPIPQGLKILLALVYVTSLTFSFILIIIVVKRASAIVKKKGADFTHSNSRIHSFRIDTVLKKAKLFVFILLMFVICWLPYSLLAFLANNVFKGNIYVLKAKQYSSLLTLGHSSVNWIIYGLKNRQIKSAFSKVLFRWIQKPTTNSSRSISTFNSTMSSVCFTF